MSTITFDQLSTLSYPEIQSKAIELGISPIAPIEELVNSISTLLFPDQIIIGNQQTTSGNVIEDKGINHSSEQENTDKKNNNKKRRRKKKSGNESKNAIQDNYTNTSSNVNSIQDIKKDTKEEQIDYVEEELTDIMEDPTMSMFAEVFHKFNQIAQRGDDIDEQIQDEKEVEQEQTLEEFLNEESDNEEEGKEFDGREENRLSKKKLKKDKELLIAELKQSVKNPDDVEWVDITALDPKLLVHLKSYRNVVPVPFHWLQKRKYLQNKRGLLKKPFDLPEFIKETGIMGIREAVLEKEDANRLKQKARDRLQPKMGKIEIDYQKLHDAFFRYQTKPKMTIHGELYYEGKENETKLVNAKPGFLSEELKEAVNMPPLAPPPWLVNMQRYGPPPSYPQLKIPGLNAPIPPGAQWGYHPGGWGKPPVDEYNRPLYGDVFGEYAGTAPDEKFVAPMEKHLWGEFEIVEEEEEEEEEEEGEEYPQDMDISEIPPDGYETAGLVTPSGLTSIPAGLETPDHIELRKETRSFDTGNKQLFNVVSQKDSITKGFVGSQHVYDLTNLSAQSSNFEDYSSKGNVQISINPEDLEKGLSKDALQKKYAESKEVPVVQSEDFSDMVAEHATKQAKKRQNKDEKKKKDFKF